MSKIIQLRKIYMKTTTKTASQVALENTRQELKDIKAAARLAAVDLKKNVATLRYEMKKMRENIKTDKKDERNIRKIVIADHKLARATKKAEKIDARDRKRIARVQKANMRADEKRIKRDLRSAAKAARVTALEAKLEALKNPVGIAAKKAAKKPSKVVITTGPVITAALEAAMNRMINKKAA